MVTVSIIEAAQRLGVSQDTVRRRIRRGALSARQEPTAQGFVWLVEVADAPTSGQATANGSQGAQQSGIEAIKETNAVLHEAMEILRGQLEDRTREIQQLHVLLQQAQTLALPAPKANGAPWWKRLWSRLW